MKYMDSILVNDKINDYFNKLIKKNSGIPTIQNNENIIINNNDNNTVFSEEDRQNLIKIIDDLTIENYKFTLNNNTNPIQPPQIQQPKTIKEMNGNLNGDFLNVNNNGKYNSVINGILVESPFA